MLDQAASEGIPYPTSTSSSSGLAECSVLEEEKAFNFKNARVLLPLCQRRKPGQKIQVPQECVDFVTLRLKSCFDPRLVAEENFLAGCVAKDALASGSVPLRLRGQKPGNYWVVLKGVKPIPVRTNKKEDLSLLTDHFSETSIWGSFESLAELEVYCLGAGILVPPLVQWTRRL